MVRLWNSIALREAVINAIVHNDYTREVPPKFEIFADRIEITSAGALPDSLSQTEFFEGYSIPRNKELMRVFKDLQMVGHLGSGIPRITRFFGPECFHFTENFLRASLPSHGPVHAEMEVTDPVTDPVTDKVTDPVTDPIDRLLQTLVKGPLSPSELQQKLALKHRPTFRANYLYPALEKGWIEPTLPR
jgi:predicted HTH transcriptional regulator